MAFCDRLKQTRLEKGMTQQEVANLLGITKGAYSGYETGRREPDVLKIKKLAKVLSTTGDYLLETGFDSLGTKNSPAPASAETGESILRLEHAEHYNKYIKLDAHGMQLVDTVTDIELQRVECEQQEADILDYDNTVFLNLSDQPASAGTGAYLGPDSFTQIKVLKNRLTQKAKFAVPVSGRSMEPEFQDGDILLIGNSMPEVGDFGVFTVDGEGYVKKLGNDVLLSVNPEYSDVQINDSIRANGKVIGLLKKEWIVG